MCVRLCLTAQRQSSTAFLNRDSRTPTNGLTDPWRSITGLLWLLYPTGSGFISVLKAEKLGLVKKPVLNAVFAFVARRPAHPGTDELCDCATLLNCLALQTHMPYDVKCAERAKPCPQ